MSRIAIGVTVPVRPGTEGRDQCPCGGFSTPPLRLRRQPGHAGSRGASRAAPAQDVACRACEDFGRTEEALGKAESCGEIADQSKQRCLRLTGPQALVIEQPDLPIEPPTVARQRT